MRLAHRAPRLHCRRRILGSAVDAPPLRRRRAMGGLPRGGGKVAEGLSGEPRARGDAAQRMLQDLAEPAKGDAVQEVLQDLAEVEWGGKARKDRGPTLSLTKPSSFSLAAAKLLCLKRLSLTRAEASALPCVLVCGVDFGDDNSVAGRLFQELQLLTAGTPNEAVGGLPFEQLDQLLAGCRAAAVCPPLAPRDVTDRRKLRAWRDGLNLGSSGLGIVLSTAHKELQQHGKLILDAVPLALSRALLLSTVGAQAGASFNVGSFFGVDFKSGTFASLEDELTAYARRRPASKPLRVAVVRAGASDDVPRSRVVVSLEERSGRTSRKTAAKAMLNALLFGVDAGFSVLDEPGAEATRWARLLLPCQGPEVWRTNVPDARKAALFVQQWADTFFSAGTSRFGVKTPVEQQKTASGCLLKFRPVGTPPARKFEELDEGGLEFIAEAPSGENPRLRARRIAYSNKAVIKTNSERALLQQVERDWNEATGNGLPWKML
ncbi:unnamed protein product [Effrenium voratum]|nr:unnamed protein product [Effrenium voratum]